MRRHAAACGGMRRRRSVPYAASHLPPYYGACVMRLERESADLPEGKEGVLTGKFLYEG